MPISKEDVVFVYNKFLKRDPENDEAVAFHSSHHNDVLSFMLETIKSKEFNQRSHKFYFAKSAADNKSSYEPIVPSASYAPWRSNAEFQYIYQMIAQHTLVDHYRCWNLWHLVGQTAKLASPLDHYIEIGVWRGGTGVLMARAMARCGLSRPIYLCDTFQGVPKAGDNDPDYQGGEHSDTSIEIVASLAASAGLSSGNFEIVAGLFPETMPPKLQTSKFAFAHIDVDTYQSAKDCFAEIWPRMIPGGIVVFDDYGFVTTSGIAKLVNELVSIPDGLSMYNLTGQAVLVKVPNLE